MYRKSQKRHAPSELAPMLLTHIVNRVVKLRNGRLFALHICIALDGHVIRDA